MKKFVLLCLIIAWLVIAAGCSKNADLAECSTSNAGWFGSSLPDRSATCAMPTPFQAQPDPDLAESPAQPGVGGIASPAGQAAPTVIDIPEQYRQPAAMPASLPGWWENPSLSGVPGAAAQPASLQFSGIDFTNPRLRVRITIYPPNRRVNQGKPLVISFLPGDECEFGDKRACANGFYTSQGGEVTFLTIHSGVGGQAQAFRAALEGSGLDQAAFTLKKINDNLQALQGAHVSISQGERRVDGLELVVLSRIPPSRMEEYISAPVSQALTIGAASDPALSSLSQASQPILVFETCGWRVPGEAGSRRRTGTSASIYLGIIR